MSEHKTYWLRPDLEIAIAPAYQPPRDLLSEIETAWERERRQRGGELTDGRLYCLVRYAPNRLTIAPSHYRYLLARRRHPELAARGLDIRALAVTGIVLCSDGIVLGRRGQGVASDAGLWEAAPAGGLAQPDPARQILEEAEEEIGLPPTLIASAKIIGLVEDCASGVADIVFAMRVALDEERIQQLHIERGSDEYETIAVIPVESLPAFVEANSVDLLPALTPMLCLAGFLPPMYQRIDRLR